MKRPLERVCGRLAAREIHPRLALARMAGMALLFVAAGSPMASLGALAAPPRALPSARGVPAPPASAPGQAPEASLAMRWLLTRPLLRVIDGDTVDVDLNGDGRLDPPRERLRLLYIDTPEIEPSWKGLDLAHGLPAKAALAELLAAGRLQVDVLKGNERDRYGRTLALLRAGATPVNLELVRLGHTPFDTRFTFPFDYDAYVGAEAEAFTSGRGIWADAPSRQRYLARLRREGRTPQAQGNPAWLPGLYSVASLDSAGAVGRYASVAGVVRERRPLRKGVVLIRLGDAERTASSRTLTVVAFQRTAELLGVNGWPVAARVRVEGFLARYKGRIELRLHYARLGS